jgi:hypothetical protein
MDTGNVTEGSWRQDKDSATSLHLLRRITATVKYNWDKFAHFFQCHKGKFTGKTNA